MYCWETLSTLSTCGLCVYTLTHTSHLNIVPNQINYCQRLSTRHGRTSCTWSNRSNLTWWHQINQSNVMADKSTTFIGFQLYLELKWYYPHVCKYDFSFFFLSVSYTKGMHLLYFSISDEELEAEIFPIGRKLNELLQIRFGN